VIVTSDEGAEICSDVANISFLIGLVLLWNNCGPTVLASGPSWKELLSSSDCTHFTEMPQIQISTDSDELEHGIIF